MGKRGLNWSEDQYNAHQAKHGRGKLVVVREPEKKIIRQSGKTPNKTELRFENDYLKIRKMKGEIERYAYEPIKLKLGNGLLYVPDWYVVHSPFRIAIYEIKGAKIFDGALEKLKTAAHLYPEFEWWLYQWKGGEWLTQRVRA